MAEKQLDVKFEVVKVLPDASDGINLGLVVLLSSKPVFVNTGFEWLTKAKSSNSVAVAIIDEGLIIIVDRKSELAVSVVETGANRVELSGFMVVEFTVELTNCAVLTNEKDLVDKILGIAEKAELAFSDKEKLLKGLMVDVFCIKETREIELDRTETQLASELDSGMFGV